MMVVVTLDERALPPLRRALQLSFHLRGMDSRILLANLSMASSPSACTRKLAHPRQQAIHKGLRAQLEVAPRSKPSPFFALFTGSKRLFEITKATSFWARVIRTHSSYTVCTHLS